jgi:hypothetical protein
VSTLLGVILNARAASCRPLFIALCATFALATAGCRSDFSTPDDELRAEVLDLTRENDHLRDRNAELEAALATAQRAPDGMTPEIHAATPRVVRIELSRLSHASDEDGDGSVDVLTMYVVSKDGHGRFVQMTGTLAVNVSVLPPDADARTLARIALTPTELRDAYRSGFTGTHYTVTIPIAAPSTPTGILDVRVTYHDGHTGVEHTAHREIDLASMVTADGT